MSEWKTGRSKDSWGQRRETRWKRGKESMQRLEGQWTEDIRHDLVFGCNRNALCSETGGGTKG